MTIPADFAQHTLEVTQGNDREVPFDFPGMVPTGQQVVSATLTIRRELDGSDLVAKAITPTDTPGQGFVVDQGAATHTATLRFDLTATDTASLAVGPYLAEVKCVSGAGKKFSAWKGILRITGSIHTA